MTDQSCPVERACGSDLAQSPVPLVMQWKGQDEHRRREDAKEYILKNQSKVKVVPVGWTERVVIGQPGVTPAQRLRSHFRPLLGRTQPTNRLGSSGELY